ncbi:MAG TPA: OsmC family protein [Blastocatellia bacterium]|jgi:putative redox protein|nr:OsmC family protein [Blastocatellia bacterium]
MAEVIISSKGFLKHEVTAGKHAFMADEPVSAGGGDSGPDPYSLLLAALGACTAMTLQIYAKREGIPLEKVEISLRHGREHAKDCLSCGEKGTRLERIERFISFEGPLSERDRARLLEIASRCPVHKTLKAGILVDDYLD